MGRTDLPDDDLKAMFEQAGQVLNWRMLYDHSTGRSKGYGFFTYSDPEEAASAVRNLDGTLIKDRKLRVDFSNENKSNQTEKSQPENANPSPLDALKKFFPNIPEGQDLPAGISCTDQISKTLLAVSPDQLIHMLREVKQLSHDKPQQLSMLFGSLPQLAYAVFQALMLMGLIDTNTLSQVLSGQQPQAPPAMAPPMVQPMPAPQPQAQPNQFPPPPYPQPSVHPYNPQPYQPPLNPPLPQHMSHFQGHPSNTMTPPNPNAFPTPSAQPSLPPEVFQQLAALGPEQKSQIINIPPAMLDGMGEKDRNHVLTLKAALLSGRF